MKKYRRKHNPNLIKMHRGYDIAMLSEALHVCKETIRRWHKKEGLEVIYISPRRFLIKGSKVIRFLKEKRTRAKRHLKGNEFLCPRCRQARKSRPDRIIYDYTGKRLGKTSMQVLIKGECEACGQFLLRFSSDQRVNDFRAASLIVAEQEKGVMGSEACSANVN